MFKYSLKIILLVILFSSCSSEQKVDVSSIEVTSELVRFDSLFYKSENVLEVKSQYPMMFQKGVEDSVWINKSKNEEDLKVLRKVDSVYGNFNLQFHELEDLFKHIKYYFPAFSEPDVYTILSDFDYEYPILYSANRLFISLDMYMGSDAVEYDSFPLYIRNGFEPTKIRVDAGENILRTFVSKDPYDKNLLNEMIFNGKILYINSKLNPEKSAAEIIGYSDEKYKWCESNETEIWTYIIKNQYLYNSNPQLKKRFIDTAPFTKFFLELDRESPGRVGVWLGWQIVNSYMEHNEISLEELIKNRDAKSIFVNSKYKPRKK